MKRIHVDSFVSRWFRVCAVVLGSIGLMVVPVRAQYTDNYQTNTISGVISNWTGYYIVGSNTFADVLLIQNSGVLSDQYSVLGWEASGSNNSVSVTGTGSVWNHGQSLVIGGSGSGNNLVISDGGRVACDFGSMLGSSSSSSNNSALVSGSGSVLTNRGVIYVGNSGSGNSLVVSNGGKVISGLIAGLNDLIGVWPSSSNNSVLITGSGSVWSNYSRLTIGSGGSSNSLVIRDGGLVVNGDGSSGSGSVGASSGSSNNTVLVTSTGSVWKNNGDLNVGYNGVGNSLVISNGGLVVGSHGYVGTGTSGSNNSVLVTGSGSVWSNQTTIEVGGHQGSTGNSLAIKDGGTVVASKVNIASGNSLVLGGGNLIAANGLMISNNAILRGTGTIFADLTLAGTLAPGNSPGVLTISGNLTLQPSAILDIQLGGTTQGVDYDAIFVNGSVALDGLLQVSFINGFETNVLNSEGFIVLQGASPLGGTFSNIVSNQYGDSQVLTAGGEGYFDVEYIGNAVTLSGYHGVPEPSTLALCAVALLSLLAAFRRRTNSGAWSERFGMKTGRTHTC